jgi:VWFA-related protein
MAKSFVIGGLLFAVLAGLSIHGAAQQQPAPPSAPVAKPDAQATAPQDAPTTIRSTTRMVQLSVVVTDKKGQPVTGLKKENFKIFDENAPQDIVFLTEASPATPQVTEAAAHALPKNAFTNRFDLKGEDPGAVTIILFDVENTAPEDQTYLRKQIMSLLRALKPQDHIAIYALTSQLLVLHDFTQDDSALVEAVEKFAPREQLVFDASLATKIQFVGPATGATSAGANLGQALEQPNQQIGNQYLKMRMETTTNAMKAIAQHVSAIPGRKSLLWVSGGFPIQIGMIAIGRPSDEQLAAGTRTDQGATTICADITNQLACPQDETGTFDDQIRAAVRELNRANVAIYPIDAHGVGPAPDTTVGGPGAGVTTAGRDRNTSQTTAPLNNEQDSRDTSKKLADETGGIAFFGTNDARNALQRALDDSRYAYTLAFYPDHNKWNGQFRKLKVTVDTPGTKLRYRSGYFADVEGASTAAAQQAMKEASVSPLDATSLALIVSGNMTGNAGDRKLELRVAIDPKQLLLDVADNHHKGAVDLYFVQRSPQGDTLAAETQRIGLDLDQQKYDYLSKAGIVLVKHITVVGNASEVRVLVRDTGSQAMGSVIVPVDKLMEEAKAQPPKLENPK